MDDVHSIMQSEQEVGHIVRRFAEVDHGFDLKPELDDIGIETGYRRVQESLQQFGFPLDGRTLEKKVVFPSHDRKVSSIERNAQVEASHADSRVG